MSVDELRARAAALYDRPIAALAALGAMLADIDDGAFYMGEFWLPNGERCNDQRNRMERVAPGPCGCNLKVIAQALDDHWAHLRPEGPDFRAVLVPWSTAVTEGAGTICAALGLQVIAMRGRDPDMEFLSRWHYWAPLRRVDLPDYVPDVVAGSPAPVQLTRWKVSALRLFARLQIRGHLTRSDFRAEGVDPRRWLLPRSWLKPGPEPGTFIVNDAPGAAVPVSAQHPEVFPKIVEQERRKLTTEPGSSAGTA